MLQEGAQSPAELEAMVARRVSGEPLEQVLGWAELCGLRLLVEPGVFVPRRRTEALARVGGDSLEDVELYAADVEPAAVRCAERNVGHVATVLEGDLDAPLPRDLVG